MSNVTDMTVERGLINLAADARLPEEVTDPHGYIRDANSHIATLLSKIRLLPPNLEWNVLSPSAFGERAKGLGEVQKHGLFYADQIHQAQVCVTLSGWKAESLLRSFIRSLNSGDLVAPALLSRALLEHATSTLWRLQEILRLFKPIANSDRPVKLSEKQMKRMEEILLKAIWGTKIGTSDLHDKTLLWSRSPYKSGEAIIVNSVQGDFQKVARYAPVEGKIAFRVYEWLCDIVHPATQGLRLFWNLRKDSAPGHQRYELERAGAHDPSVTQAIVLWGVGYSVVAIARTLEAVAELVAAVESRIEPIYGLKLGEGK